MLKNRSCSTVIPAPALARPTALGHFPECTAAPAGREAELTVALAEEAESDLGEAGRAGLPEGRKPHRERARASEARPGAASREPSLNGLRLRGGEPHVTRWRAT